MNRKNKSPCKKECPDRFLIGTTTCRSTCSRYLEYQQEQAKFYEQKKINGTHAYDLMKVGNTRHPAR